MPERVVSAGSGRKAYLTIDVVESKREFLSGIYDLSPWFHNNETIGKQVALCMLFALKGLQNI